MRPELAYESERRSKQRYESECLLQRHRVLPVGPP